MRFIVHSNIWISLAAVALLCATDVLANYQLSSPHLYSIVFFSTLLTYNWQRFLSVKKRQQIAQTNMSSWLYSNLASGYMASAIAAVICVFNFFHLSQNQQFALFILSIVSVSYALPIFPSRRGIVRLRDFGLTKPFVLGITWGLVTALLPLINKGDSCQLPLNGKNDDLFVTARCLMMIGICIPFDIKDIRFDSVAMTYPTLPVKLGIKQTLILAMAFSIMGAIILVIWAYLAVWAGQ